MEALQTLLEMYDKVNLSSLSGIDEKKRISDIEKMRDAAKELKNIDSSKFNFAVDSTDADLLLSIKKFIAEQL